MNSNRHAFLLVLGLTLLAANLFTILAAPASADPTASDTTIAAIDPTLHARLAEIDGQTPLRLIVHLDGSAAVDQLATSSSPTARRIQLVNGLQQTAVTSQQALQPTLNTLAATGAISQTRSLWLINALALTARADAIPTLAVAPGVARVALDVVVEHLEPGSLEPESGLLFTTVKRGPSYPWGIERINAPGVWHGLNIDGSGVDVAIVDSGVDWQHPALLPNYRGAQSGGPVDHSGHWYSPGDPAIAEPADTLGHGTHVAGTAVGQNGIGVAPGASWLAVNVTDPSGLIYESVVHEAFAWLLAPNGDPALAPDIVNNSWGGNGAATLFVEDVAILQAAGIMPIFSAGNSGPGPGSINAPASYTTTLAVGASDHRDQVAWFSSRGPSTLTDRQTPWLVAPGADTLSAYPNNSYATSNGTSMAAPHTTGAIALLLSANPSLAEDDIWQILADTAVPITTTHPNQTSGWGRLDALATTASQLPTGTLSGTVLVAGAPALAATVTITNSSGATLTYETDANGRFTTTLLRGDYTISASAYGAQPQQPQPLTIDAGINDITLALDSSPGGTVNGQITDETGQPISATVRIIGSPVQKQTTANGRFNFNLPAGLHKLQITAPHHDSQNAIMLIEPGQTITKNVVLSASPRYLVIDTGGWYYQSQLDSYRQSFQALNLTPEYLTIYNPFQPLPTVEELLTYQAIIWTSPQDSPGYLGHGYHLHTYLDAGGRLLISGQNAGIFDGGSLPETWWWLDLAAVYQGKQPPTSTITAVANGPFTGAQITLNDGTSAGNQEAVDAALPRNDSYLTQPIFTYPNGLAAGLHAGRCRPFNLIYLGFGLEGVSHGDDRAQLLQTSLDTLQAPPQTSGLLWRESPIDDFILPGETKSYTLTVQNLSETLTDTITLVPTSADWTSTLVTSTLTIGPCQAADTVVRVTAPANAADDTSHETAVTAVSGHFPHISADIALAHKTPGQVLLVDDHRFYDRTDQYQAALAALDLPHDRWATGDRGEIHTDLLAAYDLIFWYTGYDWFAPITPAERHSLSAYLDGGGRLFLSSQDFLYYNHDTPLSRKLGVESYHESLSPTAVLPAQSPLVSPALAGYGELTYPPYRNNADGVIPTAGSEILMWHDAGAPAAIGASQAGRSVLWTVPWELMSTDRQAAALHDATAWLSDLGRSTMVASPPAAFGLPANQRAFTLTVRNDSAAMTNFVSLTNTLPLTLTLLPDTLQGARANGRSLQWQGALAPGGVHTVTYRTTLDPNVSAGTAVINEATIHDDNLDFAFKRAATVWPNAPDYAPSQFTITQSRIGSLTYLTATLHLENHGPATPDFVTTTIPLPRDLYIITDTVQATDGRVVVAENAINWKTSSDAGQPSSITAVFIHILTPKTFWLPMMAIVDDTITTPLVVGQIVPLRPYMQYFPIAANNHPPPPD